MTDQSNSLSESEDTAAEAVYPGKEAWKSLPGNRYSPAGLRKMERNWEIKIKIPKTVQVRRAD